MKKCEICAENMAKYKCPGCLIQTCSLPCVKRHKTDKGCSGQRDKTGFITMKEFTDRHLLNDYRFLEETNRRIDSTQRDRLKRRNNKPNFLVTLVREARKRGIKLKIMPYPMERRKKNLTMYHHKSQTILWQVQWVFPQADAKFSAKRLSEHSTVEELLKDYVHPTESDPVKRHLLKAYCQEGLQNCRLFMKVEERPANNVKYHELCCTKTLQKNLLGKCIVEYPVIHVVLGHQSDSYSILDTVTDTDSDSSEEEIASVSETGVLSREVAGVTDLTVSPCPSTGTGNMVGPPTDITGSTSSVVEVKGHSRDTDGLHHTKSVQNCASQS